MHQEEVHWPHRWLRRGETEGRSHILLDSRGQDSLSVNSPADPQQVLNGMLHTALAVYQATQSTVDNLQQTPLLRSPSPERLDVPCVTMVSLGQGFGNHKQGIVLRF
jgi:hypothetical protein